MSHPKYRPATLLVHQGISKKLLRISVGLEDVEDLWEDLERGLNWR